MWRKDLLHWFLIGLASAGMMSMATILLVEALGDTLSPGERFALFLVVCAVLMVNRLRVGRRTRQASLAFRSRELRCRAAKAMQLHPATGP